MKNSWIFWFGFFVITCDGWWNSSIAQQCWILASTIFLLFFQNSLSVLSTNVIQQFLDELTFREVLGKTSLQSFDGLISRIASQTSYVCKRNATMSTRLRTVADNPFGDWRMTFSSVPVIDGKDWKEFTLLAVFENTFVCFWNIFTTTPNSFHFLFELQWSCQVFIHDRLESWALVDLQKI